jgi:hypothetical protein
LARRRVLGTCDRPAELHIADAFHDVDYVVPVPDEPADAPDDTIDLAGLADDERCGRQAWLG